MAQVQPSHHQLGGPRLHARHGSASSILAATTFGVNYNPLATPSSATSYDSMAWNNPLSVSPSIWSPNHVGNCQWPAMRQPRAPVYYGSSGYAYARQQTLPPGMVSVPGAPVAAPAPHTQHAQHAQQHTLAQHSVPAPMGQQMLVPPVQTGSSMPVSMPASAAAYPPPSQMLPQVPQFPVYALRAPMQSYQTIAAPESGAAALEYNATNMARFVATVGSGLLLGKPASFHEVAAIEQFLQTLLCSTRLPRSTVLTSLVLLKQFTHLRKSDPQLQCLSLKNCFLVSFVLANKVNDDNTFTNASWGLVSGMPAKQLTAIELAWLDAAQWNVSLDDQGENEWAYWQNYWLQTEQQALQQCPSPVTPTSLWPNQGYFFEPFSVAAC